MRRYMALDKAKTHILPISTLGIMQMTRQRMQESVSSGLYTDCPYCRGKGIVKSATTVSVELQRKLSGIVRRARNRATDPDKPIKLRVLVNPAIIDRLREEDADLLISLEKDYHAQLPFRSDPHFHIENYRVIDVDTGAAYG
ncbi:MAG: ribonuclease E/G, partial [Opitutales bacterium]|nr:ribonuclease E/G [Opitutales bacterium]